MNNLKKLADTQSFMRLHFKEAMDTNHYAIRNKLFAVDEWNTKSCQVNY